MIRKFLIITLLLLLSGISVYADIRLYLLPEVEPAKGRLTIKDIARIDCDPAIKKFLEDINISPLIQKDGYIDRREIGKLVRNYTMDLVLIYGNAVKVGRVHDSNYQEPKDDENFSIRSGDTLSVIINKNGISIEMPGTALEEGKMGDEILVKIKNSKRIKGIIKGEGIVEVIL